MSLHVIRFAVSRPPITGFYSPARSILLRIRLLGPWFVRGETPSSVLVGAFCKNMYSVTQPAFVFVFRGFGSFVFVSRLVFPV